MSLEAFFEQQVKKNKWWRSNDKVLLAVSGGVDSMALFYLILHLPETLRPQLSVAHINHQLRDISHTEEQFVANECKKYHVPFFSTTWTKGKMIKTNIEQAARVFRYHFFEKVMVQENIPTLLTAHHQNDQVETVLMRLINGNRLNTLVGIPEERQISQGKIIRPFIEINKRAIYQFMEKHDYPFYEDETNHESDYFRNRLRNDLLPSLRVENKQVDEHLLQFQAELVKGLSIIEKAIAPLYEASVHFSKNSCEIDVSLWQTYASDFQHFLLNQLTQDLQSQFDLPVSKKTQTLIEKSLTSDTPNQVVSLKNKWVLTKQYKKAIISQKKVADSSLEENRTVTLNEGIFLSETEWVAYYESDSYEIPKKVKTWKKTNIPLKLRLNETLLFRKRKPGDRLVINDSGQTKKIARYFIDEKIPASKREKSWVIEGENKEVKWLLPFRGSYLSIRDETDKINYKLVYYYIEDE